MWEKGGEATAVGGVEDMQAGRCVGKRKICVAWCIAIVAVGLFIPIAQAFPRYRDQDSLLDSDILKTPVSPFLRYLAILPIGNFATLDPTYTLPRTRTT